MTIDDVFVIENAPNKKRAENILNSLFVWPHTDWFPLLVTHCVPLFGGYRPFIELHAGRYTVLIWAA